LPLPNLNVVLRDEVQAQEARSMSMVGAPDDSLIADEAISVYIADDHLLLADSLAAAIDAEHGMKVVGIAGTCAETLEAMSRHPPDVLLLDQRLPDGLGTDLLPQLFTVAPEIKVILVTGEASDAVLVAAIQGGCAGFFRKGARAAELMEAIRGAVENELMIDAGELRRLLPRLRSSGRLGDDLTERERSVLRLLAGGTSTTDIAQELFIAPATARNHVQSVISKLGAHSRLEAVSIALREHIIDLPG
jgi:two-component system, NarL family, nitrate/nitrite response regulator NarL